MRRVFFVCALMALSGCATPYERYYTSTVSPAASIQFLPYSGEPQIVTGYGSAARDADSMYANGYGAVGYAAFVGPAANRASALAQAKKVGAQYVVVAAKYESTATGAIPFNTPTTTTSFGSGVVGGVPYSGTATTYGTETNYIPYSIARYNQTAIFFAPLERRGFGVKIVQLTPEMAEKIGTNKGVFVTAIRKGSPAFNADVLPGDVITTIGGRVVFDQETAQEGLKAAYGTDAKMTLLRNGQMVTKVVRTNANGSW